MRVLCLTNMYPGVSDASFGTFVKEQVDDLRTLGVDIAVVAFDGRRDRAAYARAVGAVRQAVRDGAVDLVHAHYGLTGAVALGQRRVPVVVTFHGSDAGLVRWQAAISWCVARGATPVFVNDDAARRLGRPHAPVICAGVDMELFTPRGRRECRRELGWDEDGRYVLLPGARANAVKRADLFDASMAVARRSDRAIRAVSLEGYTRAAAAGVLNAVDVTLMTSDDEGSPVAVKESLACATPVVSVPVADVPGLVAGLPGCAVAPRDPRALAGAVLAALDAPRSSALRRRVEPFARPRIAERTLALYRSVLDGARKPARRAARAGLRAPGRAAG